MKLQRFTKTVSITEGIEIITLTKSCIATVMAEPLGISLVWTDMALETMKTLLIVGLAFDNK